MNTIEQKLEQFNKKIAEKGIVYYDPKNIQKYIKELDNAAIKLSKEMDNFIAGLEEDELKDKAIINERFYYAMFATEITMFVKERSIPFESLQPYIQSQPEKYVPKVNNADFLKTLKKMSQDDVKGWDAQKIALFMVQTINDLSNKPVKYMYDNLYQKCHGILLIIAAQKLNIRICKQCREPFLTKDPRVRYCNQECKQEKKQQDMRLKRSGVYKEIEKIHDLYRKRKEWGYAQDKSISYEEYLEFEKRLLAKLRKGKISEEECLMKFRDMHTKIKT